MVNINFRKSSLSFIRVIILLACAGVYGQDITTTVMPALSSPLESLANNHVREEVYIQTSKNIYETSEDLWFKGTVLNAQYHTPSFGTKTLYVSLLQLPEKKVVWEEKYTVVNGFTDGHIYLQDTLQSGEYVLVAQTGFSINPDEKVIRSIRKIEVIRGIADLENRGKTPETAKLKPDAIDFQLMPEGGHLVAGITSKVAFKVVNAQGYPLNIKGTLYNGSKVIGELTGFHNGMGVFYILPAANAAYTVKLEGYDEIYPLPEIKSTGQVLQLAYRKDDIVAFKVAQSAGLPQQKMYIRLQIRGVVYNTAEFLLNTEKLIKLQVGELPQGIAEVTLLNADLTPVAERLVFVNPDRKVNLTATINKKNFGTKEKVQLKLMAADDKGQPVVAHFGVSVSDDIYIDPKDSETIQSYYNLSTQIMGKICDPGYYFNPANKNREQALDVLLLTQGWRAYKWSEQNLLSQNPKKKPFVSDTLTGSIYAKKKKAEELLGKQYVMSHFADKDSEKMFLEVSNDGHYKVLPENRQFSQRGYVYFKLLYGKDNIGIRRITDPADERLRKFASQKDFEFAMPGMGIKKEPIKEERFRAARNVNMLKEVVLTARTKKTRRFSDKYMGTLDSLAAPTDYVCRLNVLNCNNHPMDDRKPVEGQIYKDPFTDMPMAPYKYPKYTEEELLEKFSMTRIKGYYPPKEFYNPVYDVETIDNTDDFRNTLFWKADVITDANGVSEIEFFTSDINSKFRVVVEGVTGDGLLGSVSSEFKVEKKALE